MSDRRNIMLGTAGHVDHGKTALVKLLTGCETDTLAEEKQRGLTIDLGFAPCRLADRRVVGIVDVPGHVDFIRNMVAGAHGIDVVILVVAADDGVMPQTHEHLHILKLMGLRHGLVALTKIDLVDPARRADVIARLRAFLADTFLAHAPICPLSCLTGEGFDGFSDSLNEVVAACADRPCRGLFRLWVQDVFSIRGSGTILTGVPTGGIVRPGLPVWLLPARLQGRVRRMQIYGEDATEGRAGECVALNVPELDYTAVRRGTVLCESDALPLVTMVEAELDLLPDLTEPLPDGLEAQLHIGTASAACKVAKLDPGELAPAQRHLVQLRLGEPLPLIAGERFVLRSNVAASGSRGLSTIGGGRILGTSNTRLRRHKPWILASLAARQAALDNPVDWMDLILRESAGPLTVADLQRKCLSRPEEATAILDQLCQRDRAMALAADTRVHRTLVDRIAANIQETVQHHHLAHPHRAGIARDDLLPVANANKDLLELALGTLIKSGRLEWNGATLNQPGWTARLSNQDEQLSSTVAAEFRKAGWSSPGTSDLALRFQSTPQQVETAIRWLLDRGILVRLDNQICMHRDAVEAAKDVVLRLFERAPCFTTMAFRDALAVSRKFAVPLLDHLDRVRFTVRSGHDRTPGVEARKRLSAAKPGASSL